MAFAVFALSFDFLMKRPNIDLNTKILVKNVENFPLWYLTKYNVFNKFHLIIVLYLYLHLLIGQVNQDILGPFARIQRPVLWNKKKQFV